MSAASTINAAFAGIDRNAVFIIVVVALISTIRRQIKWIFAPPFSEWLSHAAETFVENVILGVVVVHIAQATAGGVEARLDVPLEFAPDAATADKVARPL